MLAEVITCSKIIALHGIDSRQPLGTYSHHRGIVNCVSINHTSTAVPRQTRSSPAAVRTARSSWSLLTNQIPNSSRTTSTPTSRKNHPRLVPAPSRPTPSTSPWGRSTVSSNFGTSGEGRRTRKSSRSPRSSHICAESPLWLGSKI
jgi:hypothetical protein